MMHRPIARHGRQAERACVSTARVAKPLVAATAPLAVEPVGGKFLESCGDAQLNSRCTSRNAASFGPLSRALARSGFVPGACRSTRAWQARSATDAAAPVAGRTRVRASRASVDQAARCGCQGACRVVSRLASKLTRLRRPTRNAPLSSTVSDHTTLQSEMSKRAIHPP